MDLRNLQVRVASEGKLMTLALALKNGSDIYEPLFATLDANTSPKGHWSIERNPQRGNYWSVREEDAGVEYNWLSDAHRDLTYNANSMVVLHWYQDTPVGSYKIAALDFYWLAVTLVDKFREVFS